MWVLEFWIQALEIPQHLPSPRTAFLYPSLFLQSMGCHIDVKTGVKTGHRISLVSSQTILKLLSNKKRSWRRSPPWSSMTKPSDTPYVIISPICWDQGTNSGYVQTGDIWYEDPESRLVKDQLCWLMITVEYQTVSLIIYLHIIYMASHILQWHPRVSVLSEATVSIIPITPPFLGGCLLRHLWRAWGHWLSCYCHSPSSVQTGSLIEFGNRLTDSDNPYKLQPPPLQSAGVTGMDDHTQLFMWCWRLELKS